MNFPTDICPLCNECLIRIDDFFICKKEENGFHHYKLYMNIPYCYLTYPKFAIGYNFLKNIMSISNFERTQFNLDSIDFRTPNFIEKIETLIFFS